MTTAKRDSLYINVALLAGVLLIGTVIFFLFMFVAKSFQYGFSIDGAIPVALLAIISLVPIQTFLRSSAIYSASKEDGRITFENYFTGKKTHYEFDAINGYAISHLEMLPYFDIKYRVIWIVKDNKVIQRIDERYIKNSNELEEELKELPYLGYQKIRLWKRFKMIFGLIEIE